MLENNITIRDQELPFPNESDTIYDNHGPEAADFDPSNECSICHSIREYKLLTLEMIEEIKFLRAEVIRWRQALMKYLPIDWADGLRQDIFDNIFPYFEDYDAYQWFVKDCCNGIDPFDNPEQSALLNRLKDGTDETSISYL